MDHLALLQAAPEASSSASALAAQWGINGAILAALGWTVVALRKMYDRALDERDGRIRTLEERDQARMAATAKIQDSLEEAVKVMGRQNEALMLQARLQEEAMRKIIERLDRIEELRYGRGGRA